MKTPRYLTALVVLTLTFAACGEGGTTTTSGTTPTTSPPEPSGELARADVPRASATDVTAAELAALVGGNTAFAFDLFRLASADGENTLLSPYSIAAALTMTYAGARGTTAEEMREALHLALGDDRIHAGRNELDLRVTTVPELPDMDDREPFDIRVANSLWGQHDYPFLEDFLVLLAENYDAGMNLVDFVTAAEVARQTINSWVEDQTAGRIVDLIPQGVITDLTRLVLVNAIWFKANWTQQFDPAMTEDGSFTLLDGSEVTAPLMHGSARTGYAEGDGYRAVRLAYAGDASMLILLPDAGRFEEVKAGFGPAELAALRAALSEHQVDLALPKFEFRSQFSLKSVLKDLGMVAAFTEPSLPDGADFTGMTERRELFVHEVVHQAFIAVDEQGTEAAAATAVIVGLESAPPPATMNVDRPFLFFIEHTGTGEILFLGQLIDPS